MVDDIRDAWTQLRLCQYVTGQGSWGKGIVLDASFPSCPIRCTTQIKDLRLRSQLEAVPVPNCMRDATQSKGCRGLVPRSLPDPEQMILLTPSLHARRVVMLPHSPSSQLSSGDGRRTNLGLHHQYCRRCSLTLPSPSLAWLAPEWPRGAPLSPTHSCILWSVLLSTSCLQELLPTLHRLPPCSRKMPLGLQLVCTAECLTSWPPLHAILLGQASIRHCQHSRAGVTVAPLQAHIGTKHHSHGSTSVCQALVSGGMGTSGGAVGQLSGAGLC